MPVKVCINILRCFAAAAQFKEVGWITEIFYFLPDLRLYTPYSAAAA
jgi:hypothetical protein